VAQAERERAIEPLVFNNFIVRLAETPGEIEAAQALRYRVFYEEMTAHPTAEMRRRHLDFDAYDSICDHLLVIDSEARDEAGEPAVVGTYRLLRRSVAERHGGFYTAQEFDVSSLLHRPGEIVELGRSCVEPSYRSRGVVQLLWRGLAAYVLHYDIDVLFGCASFPGTEPEAMSEALSYLHHFHLAPRSMRPRALDHHYVSMSRLPRAGIDVPAVVNELPPLIKGYLRLGGLVGDGAVVDRQFNTVDVCMIVRTDRVTRKYDRHYRRPAAECTDL
jgi:putative hemolysin